MLSPMYGSRGDSEEGIVGNPRVIHIITEGACMCTQNRGLRRWAESPFLVQAPTHQLVF